MAFNANIPQPTDTLSQSQADILANFQAIAPLFVQGIDPFVIFPVQGSAPSTGASQLAIYSKDVSGTPQLFMRQQSNGTEFNFTSSLKANAGWTYLPSGVLMKWGRVGITLNNQPITLPTGGGIPAFTQIFNIQLTPVDTTNNNFSLGLRSITGTTGFTVYCNNPTAGTSLHYLITGV